MTFRVEKELPRPRASVREEPVDWAGAKAAMVANSPDWVLIAENVHASTGDQLRLGHYAVFSKEEVENFEFKARKPKDATYGPRRTDIWGRYMPAKKGKR